VHGISSTNFFVSAAHASLGIKGRRPKYLKRERSTGQFCAEMSAFV
jgi:hypothetical protein